MIRWLATLALVGLAGAAAAQEGCDALSDPGAVAAAAGGPEARAAVQAGLRVAFGEDARDLSDGVIGPVTLSFLGQLCAQVPLAAGTDPVAGTLDLAREYAALSREADDWTARIADPALLAAATATFNRDVLRLAGPPQTSAQALAGTSDPADCAALATAELPADPAGLVRLQAGLAALLDADPNLTPLGDAPETRAALAQACAAYPAGGTAALVAEVQRLGDIAAAVPDALPTLASAQFARWLEASQAVRLGRLLGTVPAVVRLLQDYLAEAGPVTIAEVPGCEPPDAAAIPTWFALDPADLEKLAARATLNAALAPIAAERFADRDALVAAVNGVLGLSLPDCGARRVQATVARHEEEATVYALDAEALQHLALVPDLADVLPALQPLAAIESDSREALEAGVEAAVRASVRETAAAAATRAADAAAAAAENVSPSPDTPAPGIPAAAPAAPSEEFAITESSLLMLQAAVPDESMLEAISSTPYRPLESRDLVRSDMLNALQPVVAGIADDRTRERMEAVLPTVRMRWRLGDAAIADLAADPAFAAIPPEALTALAGLSGIAYPDERLFDGALASLPVPLDPATNAAILDVARKRVAEPYARRQVAPIAADCGCNVGRRPNSLVYAFYPFWSFAGAEDAAPPPVDFDLVGRIAFDGLLLDAHGQLNYAAHWKDAAATFTASAHRHQAKVDLAIRLRGWRDWTDEAARLAASSVVEEMTRPHAEANLVRTPGMLGRLDRYLSRDPDGVTLIVEGYTGAARSAPGIDRLVTFVRTVAEELDDSGRTVNLAFDIPLLDPATAAAPLFQDLRGLLVDVADPERRVVEHVLVFLERPTSRAKKVLRARVESSFKGEERIQVLRALIPVVPPGANAPLEPHQSDGLVELATSETNSYGQFRDDIVYFQDNFDGIGFWPAPVAGATLPDGSPDLAADLVAARYYAWVPPLVPRAYEALVRDGVDGACALICPNRVLFYLAGAATGGLAAAVAVLSLYSGRSRTVAHRLFLVPALLMLLLAILVATAACDTDSRSWSVLALLGLMMLTSGSVAFHWYERRVDGPMP